MGLHFFSLTMHLYYRLIFVVAFAGSFFLTGFSSARAQGISGRDKNINSAVRQRISLNEGWRFMRYNGEADNLVYEVRPEVERRDDNIVADTKPTDSGVGISSGNVLKKWILPTAK